MVSPFNQKKGGKKKREGPRNVSLKGGVKACLKIVRLRRGMKGKNKS